MSVDEVRCWLAGVPGDTSVAVAVLEQCGATIEPSAGMAGGVTFDLDDDTGALQRVRTSATPTRVEPANGDYLCACGAGLRFERGAVVDHAHSDCE